ncbi:uncharacterized protein Dana_GF11292 [Drosophila ananassae]|uniref:Carboxylic ester hydrolase n=1 Tax=Drosophila ananassae TaxID=7217 RepID=B3MF48_DROAN|nr:juvenile hormone esterase [Drosophila ananassae]EDV37676.1 uncharacterized protein Dana_GF11292 [Drosophila ananassae]
MLVRALGALFLLAAVSGDSLDVCLQDLGCLKGTEMPGFQTGSFESFLGIPFAQPPVGELRFKNPKPATAWNGVRDAGTAMDSCLQRNYFIDGWPILGSEDCLYLNVYRPKEETSTLLPVMVYVHSGGFFSGSAHPIGSGPEYLMDAGGVIVVTISYRVGPFGFLSTGDEHMPGNFGLKDQRLALQWVQRYIRSFGGDPDMVTLFGHSAGGVSTHLHMLSPGSKGLFHRAMSLTGMWFSPTITILKDPLSQTRYLAKLAGIAEAESLSSKDLAQKLSDVDATKLLKSIDSLKVFDTLPQLHSRPVIEPVGCPDAFLVEDPLTTHLSGNMHQVPWVISYNSRTGEGTLTLLHAFVDAKRQEEFNENFLEHMALALSLPEGTDPEVVQDIFDAYQFHGKGLNNDTLLDLAEISGDFNFFYPMYQTIVSYAGYADLEKNPLSVYIFDYEGSRPATVFVSGNDLNYGVGAGHMEDGLHTIRIKGFVEDYPKDSLDAKVTQRMSELVTQFGKTGIFREDATCQASDLKDQKMCNYLFFYGHTSTGTFQESVQNSLDLTRFALWKKLYMSKQ